MPSPTTASDSRIWWFLHLALKIWIGLILLMVLAAVYLYFTVNQPAKIGEHTSRDQAPLSLPSSATEVCFYIPPPLHPSQAYEFDVPEADFRAWAAERGWPLQPIGASGHRVRRYTSYRSQHDDAEVRIADGLYYDWREEDRGVQCGYDRATGRCYVFTHSR